MCKTGCKPLEDLSKGNNSTKLNEVKKSSRRKANNFFSSGEGILIGSSTSVKPSEEEKELYDLMKNNYRVLEKETADNLNYDSFSFFEKHTKRRQRINKSLKLNTNLLPLDSNAVDNSGLETMQLNSLQFTSLRAPLRNYDDNIQTINNPKIDESVNKNVSETKPVIPALLSKTPEQNYYESKEYISEQKALIQIQRMREKMYKTYEENKQKEHDDTNKLNLNENNQKLKATIISKEPEINKDLGSTKKSSNKSPKKIEENTKKEEEDDSTAGDNESKSQTKNEEESNIKLIGANENMSVNPSVETKVIDSDYFQDKLAKMKYIRSIKPDAFQKRIMSTEIFNYFRKGQDEFMSVPEVFDDYKSYREYWLPLFEYESYSQLINLRKEGAKWRIANMGWSAKLQFTYTDSKFVYFKMEEPVKDNIQFDWRNHCGFQTVDDERVKELGYGNKMNWWLIMDSLRENDLLILSQQRLTGIYDLFDLTNEEKADRFFTQVLPKNGKFIAIIDRRRKLNETSIGLKTDNLHKEDLKKLLWPDKKVMPIFYWYFLTSLSTVLREYKALHAIEYSPYIKKILNPGKALDEELNNSLSPDYNHWQEFLNTNGKYFNESQQSALRRVTEMKKQEILLIQGPVSITYYLKSLIYKLNGWYLIHIIL